MENNLVYTDIPATTENITDLSSALCSCFNVDRISSTEKIKTTRDDSGCITATLITLPMLPNSFEKKIFNNI